MIRYDPIYSQRTTYTPVWFKRSQKKGEMLSEFDWPWQHSPAAHRLFLPFRAQKKDECAWKTLYHQLGCERTGATQCCTQ